MNVIIPQNLDEFTDLMMNTELTHSDDAVMQIADQTDTNSTVNKLYKSNIKKIIIHTN